MATREAIIHLIHRIAVKVGWQSGRTRCKEESGDGGLCGIILIDYKRLLYSQHLSVPGSSSSSLSALCDFDFPEVLLYPSC
jgi:hypothetical protein